MTTVTLDELAREIRRILADVERSGEGVVIVRDNRAVARLMPEVRGIKAEEFFGDLPGMLTDEEGAAWLRDAEEMDRALDPDVH
jgi:antitoxin (DNA-binding transcriptional repressor) of toxin-antitoxin stability system